MVNDVIARSPLEWSAFAGLVLDSPAAVLY